MRERFGMTDKVKALVLTYDKQIGLAQLLVKKYVELGLAELFEFVVPINSDSAKFYNEHAQIKFVNCDSDILSTMKALLEQTNDEEWVYWAIDDRYPVKVKLDEFLSIHEAIGKGEIQANGVKLLPWREPCTDEKSKFEQVTLVKQKPYSMFGFWHHHYVKSKVLRAMFIEENPDGLNDIRLINNLHRDKNYLSFLEDVWVSDKPLVELAEPLFASKLTKNGLNDLRKYHCEVPSYPVIDDSLAFYDCDEQLKLFPKKPKFVDENYFE